MKTVNKKKNININKEIINKIKGELVSRKKQIIEDLKAFSSDNENSSDKHKVKFPDYGDKTDENAQEIGEYSTNLAAEKVLESTLRDINNSLDRIEDGTYGICKYCHEEIAEKRLIARPVASACVKCKTKLQSTP